MVFSSFCDIAWMDQFLPFAIGVGAINSISLIMDEIVKKMWHFSSTMSKVRDLFERVKFASFDTFITCKHSLC